MPKTDNQPLRLDIDPARPVLILSDTHGTLLEPVIRHLLGVQLILHAGDVDTPETFSELQAIAPVVLARGNMDFGGWAKEIPAVRHLVLNGFSIVLVHNITHLDGNHLQDHWDAIVHGHTHRPVIETVDHTLVVNPGSASYPKHGLSPSLVRLWIDGSDPRAEMVIP